MFLFRYFDTDFIREALKSRLSLGMTSNKTYHFQTTANHHRFIKVWTSIADLPTSIFGVDVGATYSGVTYSWPTLHWPTNPLTYRPADLPNHRPTWHTDLPDMLTYQPNDLPTHWPTWPTDLPTPIIPGGHTTRAIGPQLIWRQFWNKLLLLLWDIKLENHERH